MKLWRVSFAAVILFLLLGGSAAAQSFQLWTHPEDTGGLVLKGLPAPTLGTSPLRLADANPSGSPCFLYSPGSLGLPTCGSPPSSLPPSGAAAGDLGGNYPSPTVVAGEFSGTRLSFGAAADGALLKRSGTAVVGATAGADFATVINEDGISTGTLQLASLPAASLPDGTVARVTSVDDSFVLLTSTLTPDGLNIVAASGKNGHNWVRLGLPTIGAAQATWYVDPSNTSTHASDENDGATSSTPLLTLAEHARRLRGVVLPAVVTLNLMSDQQSSGDVPVYDYQIGSDGGFTIQGTKVPIYSGTVSSTHNATNAGGAIDDTEITDTGIPTSYTASGIMATGVILTRTNGTVASFYAAKDMGSKTLRTSWLSDPSNPTAVPVFNIGDSYTAYRLPKVFDLSLPRSAIPGLFNGQYLVDVDIHLTNLGGITRWGGGFIEDFFSVNAIYDISYFQNCAWDTSNQFAFTAPQEAVIGGLLRGSGARSYTIQSSVLNFEGAPFMVQGAHLSVEKSSVTSFVMSCYDSTAGCLNVFTNSKWLFTVGGLSGSGNAGAMAAVSIGSTIGYAVGPIASASSTSSSPLSINGVGLPVGSYPIDSTGEGIFNYNAPTMFLGAPGSNGLLAWTGSTTTARTLTNTDGTITFTNPDGVAANPVINTTGLTPSSRTVTGTAPIAIAGDHAAHDLSANRTWSLDANGVTYAFIQQAGASRLLGNATGSTANVAEIGLVAPLAFSGGNEIMNYDGASLVLSGGTTLVRAALTGDVTAGTASNTTAFRSFAATSVLGRAAGTSGVPTEISSTANNQVLQQAAGSLSFAQLNYTQLAGSVPAVTSLTGDVTGTGPGATATTISSHAVSYAKMQQVGAVSLLGNATGSTANAEEITLGSHCSFTGTVLDCSGGSGTVTNVSGTAGQVNVVNNTTTPVISLPNVGPGATTTGTAGIQSITTDAQGRVVSAATATYLTSSGTTPGTYNNITVASTGLVVGNSNTSWVSTSGAVLLSAGLAAVPTGDSLFLEDPSGHRLSLGQGTFDATSHFVTSSDTAPTPLTAWSSKHVVIGASGSTGAGIGFSHDGTAGAGHVFFVHPNVAWEQAAFHAQFFDFYSNGTTLGLSQDISGNVYDGQLMTNGLMKTTGGVGMHAIASASDVSTALGTGSSTGILEATSGAYGTVTVDSSLSYSGTTLKLPDTGVTAGTYGGAGRYIQSIHIDAKGRTTTNPTVGVGAQAIVWKFFASGQFLDANKANVIALSDGLGIHQNAISGLHGDVGVLADNAGTPQAAPYYINELTPGTNGQLQVYLGYAQGGGSGTGILKAALYKVTGDPANWTNYTGVASCQISPTQLVGNNVGSCSSSVATGIAIGDMLVLDVYRDDVTSSFTLSNISISATLWITQ